LYFSLHISGYVFERWNYKNLRGRKYNKPKSLDTDGNLSGFNSCFVFTLIATRVSKLFFSMNKAVIISRLYSETMIEQLLND
jgi:hypothetical protein